MASYAPMIKTAPCDMFLMRADLLRGQVGGGWALESIVFWTLSNGIEPIGECHLEPKKLINHRCIGGFFIQEPTNDFKGAQA
jgi:hypothetical protein